MTRILTAATLAAVIVGSMATGAFAMDAEIDALMTKLETELKQRGIDTDGLENLTIAELKVVSQALSNGDSAGEMRRQIEGFIDN